MDTLSIFASDESPKGWEAIYAHQALMKRLEEAVKDTDREKDQTDSN